MSERTCEGCGTSMHSPYAADQRCTLCDECAVAMPLEAEVSALRSDLQRALSERDEARAQAAAMRRALEDTIVNEGWADDDHTAMVCECGALAATPEQIAHEPECPLSSSAGRALLEEMEGLRKERDELKGRLGVSAHFRAILGSGLDDARAESADLRAENEHLENERDIARGDTESAQERERNALSLLASVRESLNAESADLRSRLERAENEARTLREVHISPAEVRRAVEEETERCAAMLRARAGGWGLDTAVGHALEVAAKDIRARGKG